MYIQQQLNSLDASVQPQFGRPTLGARFEVPLTGAPLVWSFLLGRWIQLQAPRLNSALQVAGRWALGIAVARLFTAMLLGRQRALCWLLSLDVWLPIAVLSYA